MFGIFKSNKVDKKETLKKYYWGDFSNKHQCRECGFVAKGCVTCKVCPRCGSKDLVVVVARYEYVIYSCSNSMLSPITAINRVEIRENNSSQTEVKK